jgi:hypothetical protein
MPKEEPNPNGTNLQQNIPEELHVERSQVICQRCKRKFEHFMIEEIDDLAQLRCGDVIISKTEMVCLHCGWVFYWNVREKDLEKMALAYGQFTAVIRAYKPE